MLRVNQIKVAPEAELNTIKKKAASILGVKLTDIDDIQIVKQSIDARKKPQIFYSYTVDVILHKNLSDKEQKLVKRCRANQVSVVTDKPYRFPKKGTQQMKNRPVIVGMGPAGLFCAYMLAKHGYAPVIIERGKSVEARTQDVEKFWSTGVLDKESNVQFGEGGAGTFSDGKLNTLIKDKDGRNREVLKIFTKHGADEKILYDAKPHIGTDVLTHVVRGMREEIIKNGGEVHFETKLEKLLFDQNKLTGIEVLKQNKNRIHLPCENLVLAIGHSARETFYSLYEQNVPMEAKSFAVGLRMEHPQELINEAMYGCKDAGSLGAAPYKVTAKASNGRGVYSFCMCPGGYVVNASSEEGRLAVNGMSYSDRGSENANSALIVTVTPKDFGSKHPLAGIEFQRALEEKAYAAGKGKIPVQRYAAFKACISDEEDTNDRYAESDIFPCTKGAYTFTDLSDILPDECNQALVEGIEIFGTQIKGFNRPDALLLGVESRTSSPVRISRGDNLQSVIKGLYPCGEGAGYAGGITSAAMDGIRVAEEIAKHYCPFSS